MLFSINVPLGTHGHLCEGKGVPRAVRGHSPDERQGSLALWRGARGSSRHGAG